MAARIEIYPTLTATKKKYHWRLRAQNGQIIATGHQSFANKANAKRAAMNVVYLCIDAPLEMVDGEKK